jgi:hypothetical protein
MKLLLKAEFKCPWCGEGFDCTQELNEHAKDHYHESYEECIPA